MVQDVGLGQQSEKTYRRRRKRGSDDKPQLTREVPAGSSRKRLHFGLRAALQHKTFRNQTRCNYFFIFFSSGRWAALLLRCRYRSAGLFSYHWDLERSCNNTHTVPVDCLTESIWNKKSYFSGVEKLKRKKITVNCFCTVIMKSLFFFFFLPNHCQCQSITVLASVNLFLSLPHTLFNAYVAKRWQVVLGSVSPEMDLILDAGARSRSSNMGSCPTPVLYSQWPNLFMLLNERKKKKANYFFLFFFCCDVLVPDWIPNLL